MTLLRAVLANGRIVRLEASWGLASIGAWGFVILLALYAYSQGGSGAVGLAVLVGMLPSPVAAPYTALLADRYSRRSVLFASTLARGALAAAIGGAAMAGASLAVVLVLAAAFTIAGSAHKPAQAALLPQLARTPAELASANACWSALEFGGFLGGALLAGVLAGVVSLETTLSLSGLPFLVAAALLLTIPADERPEPLETGSEPSVAAELLEGVRTVNADPTLRLLVGLFGGVTLVQAMRDVLLVIVALELLDMGESGAGWLNAAYGFGGLVAGAAAVALLRRDRLTRGLALGCVLAGVPTILVGVWPGPLVALLLLTVVGIGDVLVEAALLTLTQRLPAEEVLGRVYGVQECVYALATALGGVLTAGLVAQAGTRGALVAVGLVLPALAILVRRPLVAIEAGD